MKPIVLALIEPEDPLAPVARECLQAARQLADILGCELQACVLGSSPAMAATELCHYNLAGVNTVRHPGLEHGHPDYTLPALLGVCEHLAPRAILMAQTLQAVDLAPRIACALDTGLVTDCVAIEQTGAQAEFIKPVYSGNVMARLAFTVEPAIITLRPRAFEPASRQDTPRTAITPLDIDLDPAPSTLTVLEQVTEDDQGPALGEAAVVVAGGRGLGGPAGFEKLDALARLLQGATGASRPPCDLGWINPAAQVGQTGEIVAPQLYIAVGISGSTQHIAGMTGAATIVAINNDPRANIFKIADFGVVGQYQEVLPAFQQGLADILDPKKQVQG